VTLTHNVLTLVFAVRCRRKREEKEKEKERNREYMKAIHTIGPLNQGLVSVCLFTRRRAPIFFLCVCVCVCRLRAVLVCVLVFIVLWNLGGKDGSGPAQCRLYVQ